jgi:hypothetical protein
MKLQPQTNTGEKGVGPFFAQRNAPGSGASLIAKIRKAGKLAGFSVLPAPFFVAIVAIVATNNFHLPFGVVAAAKAQGTNPNNLVTFRDVLHNIAMPVLAMDDVIFPSHRGCRESNESAKR